jgi:hypothetical protein
VNEPNESHFETDGASIGSQLRDELQRLRAERESLVAELAPLRGEVEDRVVVREGVIEELDILRREYRRLMGDLEKAAAELSTLRANLENATTEYEATQAKLSASQQTFFEIKNKDLGLPLLFDSPLPAISQDWDSYQLESEFFTDEPLDAKRVAELVNELPGLAGCLIVKNRGPVLAGQLPEHLHDLLRVPDRNYHLLFERLPKCVQQYNQPVAHVATFQLKDGCLTVTQAKHVFVVTHHLQPRLRPGIPEKLAAVAAELAKMYP